MKFGAYLKSHLREEWAENYIDYKLLKNMIKALAEVESKAVDVPTGSSGSGERVTSLSMNPRNDIKARFKGEDITEADFFLALEDEMKKVDNFTHSEMTKLKKEVDKIAASVFSKGEEKELSENQKNKLSERARKLGEQFLVLEKYANLNYLGFHKILKKHDKQLPIPCQRFYMTRLHAQKWIKHDYSKLFVDLSKIHACLRGDVSAKNEQLGGQSFTRTTTKYWVRTGDISRVKHLILQNLPVFQHSLDNLAGDSQLTNSVYFDNSQLELYHGRLDKLPSAIAVRLRWYETEEPELVFVERKTHFDSWTGDESVKERFTLKPDQVIPFLTGQFTVDDKINEMKNAGKAVEDIENVKKLFEEIYNQIDSKQLRPTLRTQYMRVAYQIPFDATVRVSLDTNLVMITENPKVGPDCLTAGRWYRDPNIALPPTEYTLFPHAVLEVKLSLKKDQEAPEWITDLMNSRSVTKVHKFSKFIHGCATLLSKSVQAVPYWVDDESIRTSMIRALPREKRRAVKFLDDKGQDAKPLLLFGEKENFNLMQRTGSMNYGSFGDDTDNLAISEMRAYRDQNSQASSIDNTTTGLISGKSSTRTNNSVLSFRRLKNWLGFGTKKKDYYDDFSNEYNAKNKESFKVRKTPMRIEPKVFLANERTFLSWVHMSITLGSISAVLLGFASKQENERNSLPGDVLEIGNDAAKSGAGTTKLVGLILLPVSILFVCYALFVFYWRGKHIRARVDNDMFHDPVGPLVLGAVLLFSLVSIFVLFVTTGQPIQL